MVEQASLFFGAASAARDRDVDRDLLLETRPADLHSSSSPEVASQGSFRSTACPRAMRLGGAGSHVKRLSSFFDAASGSPLHTAIDALQPEPQSGPGSSIDDQMLGY